MIICPFFNCDFIYGQIQKELCTHGIIYKQFKECLVIQKKLLLSKTNILSKNNIT